MPGRAWRSSMSGEGLEEFAHAEGVEESEEPSRTALRKAGNGHSLRVTH